MPPYQVKKVVVVCFLEAAKLTLEQLGAFRLESSERGTVVPPEMSRVYGDVRRVRDYLQRCASGYGDVVDLDLDTTDAAVLVACCRRSVEAMDVRLTDQALPADERAWLQKKQQVIAHWAIELAAKPLVELPGKRPSQPPGEASRQLLSRLQQKAFGPVHERAKIVPPQSAGNNSMTAGLPSFGDQVRDVSLTDSAPDFDLRFGGSSTTAPAPRSAPPAAPETAAVPPLFDHQRVADPRLRALIGVDMRAYQRACAAADHRLATVLLSAMLEAAVLDHVLAHRAEFGVAGSPDAWNVQELLLQALGERASPKDRSLAFHLFSARNLLRPAVQFMAPMIVTSSSFEVLREFVVHALHGLGFGVTVQTLPPGALTVDDIESLSSRDS